MQLRHLFCACTLAFASQGAMALPTIDLTPSASSVMVGDTFTLMLQGTGFDLTSDSKVIDNVTGGQKFNLSFASGVLEIVSVSIDSGWTFTSGNKTGTINNTAGTLTGLAFGTFPATTADSFAIAQITFRALDAGSGMIALTGGEIAAKVAGISGVKILPSLDSTMVAVVPEPAEWGMLLAGLGLIGLRLRARQ